MTRDFHLQDHVSPLFPVPHGSQNLRAHIGPFFLDKSSCLLPLYAQHMPPFPQVPTMPKKLGLDMRQLCSQYDPG